MTTMSAVEFLLSAGLAFMFWKKDLHRRYPAMGSYLALRVVSAPVLNLLLVARQVSDPQMHLAYAKAYFLLYWAVYLASAVILLFVTMEVFRSALAGLPGLMKFGIVIFRWAVVVSVIVTFSSFSFAHGATHPGMQLIPDIATSLMRSVSILELSLLAFLCLCMNTLRLSVRDMAFGIAMGFGLMAANDLVLSLFVSFNPSLTAPLQFVYEALLLVALGVWAMYAAMPEPARQAIVMPVNSTIYRWNEIASALGHPGTQVAMRRTDSFFLTDVEKVVEKVLTRSTLKGQRIES
jgi:hypothetical protein